MEEPLAIEVFGEEAFAEGDAFGLGHPVEAGGTPGFLAAFDDEGAGLRLETIAVGLKPAIFGLFEEEREGGEQPLRPEPGELAEALL